MKERKVKSITKYILVGTSVLILLSLYNSFIELFDIHQFENKIHDENIDPRTGEEYSRERELRYVYSPKIRKLIQNNPLKAVKYIDSIMGIYPEKKSLHYEKGIALFEIDSFQKAVNELDIFIKMDSAPHIMALQYKNESLLKLNQYEESIEVLFKLVEFDTNYYHNIAQVYEWKMDYKNSIKYYQKVLRIWENSVDKERLWFEIKKVKEKIEELNRL